MFGHELGHCLDRIARPQPDAAPLDYERSVVGEAFAWLMAIAMMCAPCRWNKEIC
jgi:hypothetical protein